MIYFGHLLKPVLGLSTSSVSQTHVAGVLDDLSDLNHSNCDSSFLI